MEQQPVQQFSVVVPTPQQQPVEVVGRQWELSETHSRIIKVKVTPLQWKAYLASVANKRDSAGKKRCGAYTILGGERIKPSYVVVKFEDLPTSDKFRYFIVHFATNEPKKKVENPFL